MKRFLYDYRTSVTFGAPVSVHAIKLRCVPCANACQQVEVAHLVLSPLFWTKSCTDSFGNQLVYGGTSEPHTSLVYVSTGIVALSEYSIPADEVAPYYRMFSRLVPFIPEMACYAWPSVVTIVDAAASVCQWVNQWVVYSAGSTFMETTAADVYSLRKGVCQDFAHLMISVCRQRGFAARYVAGLLLGTGLTHAWVEVWDGKEWIGFDPTNNCRISYGYIKIAHGRDAADCSVSRGTYLGVTSQVTSINVSVQEV
ncbi:MAG: transglutaminase family protein [Paludibacteraceae bacterium]|jgi:transglutaminase-like putative cysteine protease|nr:transglutaminase family protein [Paludibacteraceae bacterium]